MSLDDWVLALHLIAAAALVGATTLLWVVVAGLRSADTPGPTLALGRLAVVGTVTIVAGALGTIVFGVWLAISLDAYEVWDGWIVASLVLWLVGSGLSERAGAQLTKPAARARELAADGSDGPSGELASLNRSGRGVALHLASTIAVLGILVLMIWKPGA